MNIQYDKTIETKRLILHKSEEVKDKKFLWTIYLKETNEKIGQISILIKEENNINCFLYPLFQKKGYAYEACVEVLKYIFLKIDIKKIITKVAKKNKSGISLIEKLGFEKIGKEKEIINYELTKNIFLKDLFRKESLYITEDIDKEPLIKFITNHLIINLTGESGSNIKSTTEKYLNDKNCIVIDLDQIKKQQNREKNNQHIYDMLVTKYNKIPNLDKNFDKIYLDILKFYQNETKLLIITSESFRYMKNLKNLKGEIIILRTCINKCFDNCLKNYQNKYKKASFEELSSYCHKMKQIYTNYHYLNNFINKIDKELTSK